MKSHQIVIDILRRESAEHLENFLDQILLPKLQGTAKQTPTAEVLQHIQEKYQRGIQTHGTFYPLNRLWSEEARFTNNGLNPKTAHTNLRWTQKILQALKHTNGWETAEQEICSTFGGYGFIPEEDYAPTLSGFRSMVENLLFQPAEESPTLGFATYLPEKLGIQNPNSLATHSSHPPQNLPRDKATQKNQTLSKNQENALKKLQDAYRIFTRKQSIGGISLRSPLLIGPSGGGKTTIVRALAEKNNLPYLLLDGADWILSGAATEPQSLQRIREFIEEHETGILAIDECDKLGTAAEDGHAWWKSVRGEIMSVIEKRADNWAGWTNPTREKFKKNFLVVGLGTWQHLFRKKPELGFQNQSKKEVSYEDLKKDGMIPEELLARFGKPIVLQPLQTNDYEEILQRIHQETPEIPKDIPKLAEQASQSGKEYRWVEDYVADLLFASLPPEEPQSIPEPQQETKKRGQKSKPNPEPPTS